MIGYGELYHSSMYDDNYLMHHGVKGMKWGVRRNRNAFSVKAAGNRFSATTMGVYEKMNRKLGEKTGNRTFKSSANAFKTLKEDQLRKAEQAQAAANAKRDARRAARNTPEAIAARRKKIAAGVAGAAGAAALGYGAYRIAKNGKRRTSIIPDEFRIEDNLHRAKVHRTPVHRTKVNYTKVNRTKY